MAKRATLSWSLPGVEGTGKKENRPCQRLSGKMSPKVNRRCLFSKGVVVLPQLGLQKSHSPVPGRLVGRPGSARVPNT